MRLEDWLDVVVDEVHPPLMLDEDTRTLLLDLVRDIAHQANRPGGPLTTFLLGAAVASGGDLHELVDRLRAKLPPATEG
jgi:hypothetical protein